MKTIKLDILSDTLLKRIARIAHEANRAYCADIGDDSQVSWDEAPEWQKESAINGVRFHWANRDAGPAASHNSWLAEKEKTGWKFGPVKDVDKKEHPCCVPYESLPASQRLKDYIFTGIVKSFAEGLK